MQTRNGLVVLFAALAALLVAVPFAWAHGGDDGLIHGCVKNGDGQLRVVDSNEPCKKSEYPLDWSASTATGGGSGMLDSGIAEDCSVSTAISPVDCFSRTLPPGIWEVEYRAVLDPGSALITNQAPKCELFIDEIVVDSYAARSTANGATVQLMAGVELASPSLLQVRCSVGSAAMNVRLQRAIAEAATGIQEWTD